GFLKIGTTGQAVVQGTVIDGAGGGAGIEILASHSGSAVVRGVTVAHCATGLSADAGATGTYVVTGSVFVDNSLGALEDRGTATTRRFATNVGINPNPSVPTPPIPPSGTSVVNATGFNCAIYIGGGTVHDVLIGAARVSTKLQSGMVRLAAGDQIALVYTTAPTWVWYGE
ncbi:MAG: hypothetical protein ABI346_06010, partial [Candidatus Baltobacteraceae bacterium]